MAQRYRKKPVVIEAMQYDGMNHEDIFRWADGSSKEQPRMWIQHTLGGGYTLEIGTLEGTHRTDPGDWVIRGVVGEFYPCKPEIFQATYEAVDP